MIIGWQSTIPDAILDLTVYLCPRLDGKKCFPRIEDAEANIATSWTKQKLPHSTIPTIHLRRPIIAQQSIAQLVKHQNTQQNRQNVHVRSEDDAVDAGHDFPGDVDFCRCIYHGFPYVDFSHGQHEFWTRAEVG